MAPCRPGNTPAARRSQHRKSWAIPTRFLDRRQPSTCGWPPVSPRRPYSTCQNLALPPIISSIPFETNRLSPGQEREDRLALNVASAPTRRGEGSPYNRRMENRRILVIDDDREIWQAYEDVLTRPNGGAVTDAIGKLLGGQPHEPNLPEFALSFAGQGQEGLHLAEEALAQGSPFAVAFIDIRMPPGWDGMETASRIRRIDPNVELVIVTAYSDRSRYEIVEAVGAPDKLLFLRKPFDPEELYQLALSLTAKWNIAKREQESRRALESSEARFRNLVETSSDWVW
ncbi:MAG TPA: response regulator, partial [Desulfobacterales bacterium]|nr:response regulator [Desulfobacterales bacterium]